MAAGIVSAALGTWFALILVKYIILLILLLFIFYFCSYKIYITPLSRSSNSGMCGCLFLLFIIHLFIFSTYGNIYPHSLLHTDTKVWTARPSLAQPKQLALGIQHHSAAVYRNVMLVYGGTIDNEVSSSLHYIGLPPVTNV